MRGVLFDLDGVLVESEGVVAGVWQRTLAEEGLTLELPEIAREFGGKQFEDVLRYLAEHYAFRASPQFIPLLEERFNAVMAEVTPIEGAGETLAFLRERGVPLAVASNSEPQRLRVKLKQAGLAELVGEHAYDPSRVGGRGKPEPELYLFAAQQLGLSATECLVIEDSLTGAAAGVRAGATVWGLLTPEHPHQGSAGALRDLGVARVLTSHAELRGALAELF